MIPVEPVRPAFRGRRASRGRSSKLSVFADDGRGLGGRPKRGDRGRGSQVIRACIRKTGATGNRGLVPGNRGDRGNSFPRSVWSYYGQICASWTPPVTLECVFSGRGESREFWSSSGADFQLFSRPPSGHCKGASGPGCRTRQQRSLHLGRCFMSSSR